MGLRAADGALQNLSYAAEAVNRSLSPLPPITSDFKDEQYDSLISQGIERVRAQVKRGLPVTAPPIETVVRLISALKTLSHELSDMSFYKAAAIDILKVKSHSQDGIDDRKMAVRTPSAARLRDFVI